MTLAGLRYIIPLLALLLACDAQPPDFELQTVPEPYLEHHEAVARQQLRQERQQLDVLLDAGGEPRELADRFGELGRLYLAYELTAVAAVSLGNAAVLAPEEIR